MSDMCMCNKYTYHTHARHMTRHTSRICARAYHAHNSRQRIYLYLQHVPPQKTHMCMRLAGTQFAPTHIHKYNISSPKRHISDMCATHTRHICPACVQFVPTQKSPSRRTRSQKNKINSLPPPSPESVASVSRIH